MEIDAEVVRQHELHHAHGIGRAGETAKPNLLRAGNNGVPVDVVGVKDVCSF